MDLPSVSTSACVFSSLLPGGIDIMGDKMPQTKHWKNYMETIKNNLSRSVTTIVDSVSEISSCFFKMEMLCEKIEKTEFNEDEIGNIMGESKSLTDKMKEI